MKHLVQTVNYSINVHDYGEREGRTILAVTGLGLTGEVFKAYFRDLQRIWVDEQLRLVAVNRPGLDSPPIEHDIPLTLSDFAAMHIEVADALNLTTFDLIGHSLGGPVVLKIAEMLGARVRTVFIIDGALYGAFLPSKYDWHPGENPNVARIDGERFVEEFGAIPCTGHPIGIAIKGENSWPIIPDDPYGGWQAFSRIWSTAYHRIIAPHLGAVLIQTSLGHIMHDPGPEDLGEGRTIHGNPLAVAHFHAGVLRACNRADGRIIIPQPALDAAGAHIAYDPYLERPNADMRRPARRQTIASLRKFSAAYLPGKPRYPSTVD
ncbi:MAG: hypothetical protein HOQ05_13180 [Corynebacteriales bacterium]|nr:hypothetical protein [Mycobacteriales bacterium]